MKTKDKGHISEDQVVQIAKDSGCMIVGVFLCGKKRENIFVLFFDRRHHFRKNQAIT